MEACLSCLDAADDDDAHALWLTALTQPRAGLLHALRFVLSLPPSLRVAVAWTWTC